MMRTDLVGHVARALVDRGRALVPLEPADAESFRTLADSAGAFFQAPDAVRDLSQWSGHGMWAGYQTMPSGDLDLIDHVDRFETPMALFETAVDGWPWLSPEARALREALRPVTTCARELVRACVARVAELQGRDMDAAQRLWCDNDASTLVVNSYRTVASQAVRMKPHADFGGLTVIHVGAGLESLQFQSGGDWVPAAADDDEQGNVVVVLIGQLFAHWLGTEAPIHRVAHDLRQQRLSTVYFHQPHLDAVIEGMDGRTIVAGDHIAAMQDHYNQLGPTS